MIREPKLDSQALTFMGPIQKLTFGEEIVGYEFPVIMLPGLDIVKFHYPNKVTASRSRKALCGANNVHPVPSRKLFATLVDAFCGLSK